MRLPPTPPTSRLTVDGALAILAAISRKESPAAIPALISSRSESDSRNGDLGLLRDLLEGVPPAAPTTLITVFAEHPKARATSGWVAPSET